MDQQKYIFLQHQRMIGDFEYPVQRLKNSKLFQLPDLCLALYQMRSQFTMAQTNYYE